MRLLEAVADGVPGGGTAHVLQLIAAVRAQLPVEVHLVSQAGSSALAEAARLGATVHGLDFFTAALRPPPLACACAPWSGGFDRR